MGIRRRLDFSGHGTTLRAEAMAGITAFLAMLYIAVAIPAMLSRGGMDFGGAYTATILASAIGMIAMGIWANCPIALAPGLGMGGYFTYAVIVSGGMPWREALGAAFIASLSLGLLAWANGVDRIAEAIPKNLRLSMHAGVGLLVAMTGLRDGHVVVGSPTTVTAFGSISDPVAFLTLVGIAATAVLMANRVPSALFWGMVFVGILAYIQGFLALPDEPFAPPMEMGNGLQMHFGHSAAFWSAALAMFWIALFDNLGGMLAILHRANPAQAGRDARLRPAMLCASLAGLLAALAGTSPVSVAAESSAGAATGGRTGYAPIVTATLFLSLLFWLPLARSIADLPACTAPALVASGFSVFSYAARRMAWQDAAEGFPAFAAMAAMPLSGSIATGMGIGLVAYASLKLFTGQGKRVHPLLYGVASLFAMQFVLSCI